MRCAVAVFCLLFHFSLELETKNVTVVIISQNNDYNKKLARELRQSLEQQSYQIKQDSPNIFITNEKIDVPDWTLTPLVLPILNSIEKSTQWILFLEDRTHVNLKKLLDGLQSYDSKKEVWIGHALHDSDATIIHHFAFYEDPTFFKYPNFGSGMVLSVPLLERLKSYLQSDKIPKLDFHIDAAHEFALFVYQGGKGPMIQHDKMFCSHEEENCGTYPKQFQACDVADISSIYFAIKTCEKFHESRVNMVKDTWLKYVVAYNFFSDIEDPKIPTTSLEIPNTEQGHCLKTMAILRHGLKLFEYDRKLQWLALVDDDTILSVSRIAKLTTCHQYANNEPLILGERYRFGAQGFNYLTGGAGILVNRPALQILVESCSCARPDAPDDMVLGACAADHNIELVHVPQMHQARPADYAVGRLATKDAITFHKYWMIDPIKTYQQWFLSDDQAFNEKNNNFKSEL